MTILANIILVAWFSSFLYAAFMIAGLLVNGIKVQKYQELDPKIYIQITTTGSATVNKIIKQIRSYTLGFPYVIWVVTEPSDIKYEGADKVVVVPQSFECNAKFKGRALEYARRLRLQDVQEEYRVLLLDDDIIPSAEYLKDCAFLKGDIIQGCTASVNNFGSIYSFLDFCRAQMCFTICAFFQGIGKPIWVHGEALCISDQVEKNVSWDKKLVASEDLVFGHVALAQGFKMSFTYSINRTTSPLSTRDFVKQRRRWIWGDLDACFHHLPWKSALRVAGFLFLGLIVFIISATGVVLSVTGIISYPLLITHLAGIGLVLWFSLWGFTGYKINKDPKTVIMSSMYSIPAVIWVNLLYIVVLFKGPIKQFEVIRKKI